MGDEELYNHFLFDLQVRYALCLQDFDEKYFDLRTIYHFRGALCEYERTEGVNLIQKATERITDKQIEKFEIKTGLQRMDSTQIQSNIQNMSGVQLLVEIIHRLRRILVTEDIEKYSERFSTYVKEGAKGYVANITETCDPDNDLQLITTTNLNLIQQMIKYLWQRTCIIYR